MYPAFTTTRPRLPSVLSVFQPIEQYQVKLGKRSPARGNAAALEPLDVYLAHLFLNVHPCEPAILDLAAEATAGASTLVGLFHPRQPPVRAVGGPLPGDRRAYRGLVEDFLRRQGTDLHPLQWLAHDELAAELQGETDTIVFLAASTPSVDVQVEQWLNILPSAIALIFGLGPIGDCAALDSLLRRFPTGSPRRLALLRESGEVLSASSIGLVADRDNTAAEVALRRLKQLFTGNYSFLGLLRSATLEAIRSTGSDTVVREKAGYFLEWNQEINRLKRERESAAEELRSIKSSFSYRLGERSRLWRERLVPDQTWRYRLFQYVRRLAGICWREGISGLLRRIVRRFLRRND